MTPTLCMNSQVWLAQVSLWYLSKPQQPQTEDSIYGIRLHRVSCPQLTSRLSPPQDGCHHAGTLAPTGSGPGADRPRRRITGTDVNDHAGSPARMFTVKSGSTTDRLRSRVFNALLRVKYLSSPMVKSRDLSPCLVSHDALHCYRLCASTIHAPLELTGPPF